MRTASKLGKLKKKLKNHKSYLLIFLVCILSLGIFIKLIEDVLTYDRITKIDSLLNSKVNLLWNPALDKVMFFITNIASPPPLVILSILISLFLIYKKRYRNFFVLVSSLLAGFLSEVIIKIAVSRLRPANSLIATRDSFPSGHATIAIIFFSFLIYCFKDDIKNKLLKIIFISINVILFLAVGFSRVYLDVHWFSDVLAGFSLGAFWLSFFIFISKFIKVKI